MSSESDDEDGSEGGESDMSNDVDDGIDHEELQNLKTNKQFTNEDKKRRRRWVWLFKDIENF